MISISPVIKEGTNWRTKNTIINIYAHLLKQLNFETEDLSVLERRNKLKIFLNQKKVGELKLAYEKSEEWLLTIKYAKLQNYC